jgi:hypothetical protein
MLRVDLRNAMPLRGAAVKTLKTTVLAEGFSVLDLHTSAASTLKLALQNASKQHA